jgi:hypothetical protein
MKLSSYNKTQLTFLQQGNTLHTTHVISASIKKCT